MFDGLGYECEQAYFKINKLICLFMAYTSQ